MFYFYIYCIWLASNLCLIIYALTLTEDPKTFNKFVTQQYVYVNLTTSGCVILWMSFIYGRFVFIQKKMYNAVHMKYWGRWALLYSISLFSLAMLITMFVYNSFGDDVDIVILSEQDLVLGWFEFLAFILPPLALIMAWLPQDLFEVYNKYPEVTKRVSMLQLKHW